MILLLIFTLLILAFTVYIFVIRPWHLHWGANAQEVKMILPGDEIISKPDFNATRSISINATTDNIWKWIIQIGSKRAGWYSIDWMDNAGIPSSNKILHEFQHIENGQFIPFTPDQKNGMWVSEFRENEYILWTDKKGMATWLWYIYVDSDNSTRLLTRLRTKYVWKGFWIIYYLIYDFGDIVMMSRCMKGIKKRAENRDTNLKSIMV
jgi:hypothetical protein